MNRPGAGVVALPRAATETAMRRTAGRRLMTLPEFPAGAPTASSPAVVPGAVAADSPAEAVGLLLRRFGLSPPEPR